MKLNAGQLDSHVKQQLAGSYWVYGDEPLLNLEACDTIRTAAVKQGFDNRQVVHVETNTDWHEVLSGANSLSLFAEKNLIELRFSNGKPNAKAAEKLANYLQDPSPDTLLLISSPKLDGSFQKGKHWKTIEPKLNTLALWPIDTHELPRWIKGRLQTQGFTIDEEALSLLCNSVEGNLLAAQQQIMQLQLAAEGKQITTDLVQSTIANDARFDSFETVDKALNGATAASLRALDGLRNEGLQPANMSWIFVREIQTLISIRQAAKDLGPDGALRQARIWKRREPIVRNALKRLKLNDLEACLQQASKIDTVAKGQAKGDAWDELASLIMQLGGRAAGLPLNSD